MVGVVDGTALLLVVYLACNRYNVVGNYGACMVGLSEMFKPMMTYYFEHSLSF
jgi:hypothetical protein